MHSSWLVEIASVWAFHAAARVEEDCPFPSDAVQEYWARSRSRFDAWHSLLTNNQQYMDSPSVGRRIRAWHRYKRAIEEVLLAEPLTRVTVAIAARLEQRKIDKDSRAILHNVHGSHQEIRNRALKGIARGIQLGISEADELNNLRQYLEHWTDMLLGYFAEQDEAVSYGHSADRIEEFAEEYSERHLGDTARVIWSLQIASCRAWLDKHVQHQPISPRLNQRISEAALAMIHPELFDSLGLMRTNLVQRIERGLEKAGETIQKLEDGSWETMSELISHPKKPELSAAPDLPPDVDKNRLS